jgi:hypothetical protein
MPNEEKKNKNAHNSRKRERTYAHVIQEIPLLLTLSLFETTREEEEEEEEEEKEEKCLSIQTEKKMNEFSHKE